jgi:hypothetical protein
MEISYKSLAFSDDITIKKIKEFAVSQEIKTPITITANMFQEGINISTDADLPSFSNINSFSYVIIFDKIGGVSINFLISRENILFNIHISSDKTKIRETGNTMLSLSEIVNKFKVYFEEMKDMDYLKIIKPDLADFYTAREAAISKIEETSMRITQNYELYRKKVDEQLVQSENELKGIFEKRSSELEEKYKFK